MHYSATTNVRINREGDLAVGIKRNVGAAVVCVFCVTVIACSDSGSPGTGTNTTGDTTTTETNGGSSTLTSTSTSDAATNATGEGTATNVTVTNSTSSTGTATSSGSEIGTSETTTLTGTTTDSVTETSTATDVVTSAASTDHGTITSDSSGEASSEVNGVTVQVGNTRQNIQGFGFNTALKGGGGNLPWDDLFGLEGPNAIGMSILRVGMNPSGNLTGFGIEEARSRGAKIIGSCWSPPGECKTSGTTQNGGHLITPEQDGGECYEAWADKIAAFAERYELYAMSIANEADFKSCPGVPVCTVAYDTTEYTAKEMVQWVKAAGPKLRAVGVKVIAPEASEWTHVWSNLSGTGSLQASHPHSSDPLQCGCFSNEITAEAEATCAQHCTEGDGYDYGHWLWADQEAWNAFDILGVHEYDAQRAYAWPADVNGGVRDREVWQTEMSGVQHWPENGPSATIENGVAVAGWIHSALTVGEASAWLYWWYDASGDNEGLALIQGSNELTKRYFTFGNYSKFIRPGYFMVTVAGNANDELLISAAKKEDASTVVVVVINKGSVAVEAPITLSGATATSCTPHVTSASENLVPGIAVPVTDGVFTASLGAMSVTSFVCE